MSNFPLFQMAEESVKFRFQEPFASDAINKKSTGIIPSGVYRGYDPNPQPNYQLFINTDGGSNDSVAVIETPTHYNLTIRTEQQLVLDFSGHTTFPVFVVLRANYSLTPHPFSGATDAKLVTTQLVQSGDVKLCQVTSISGTTPVVSITVPANRNESNGLVTADSLFEIIDFPKSTVHFVNPAMGLPGAYVDVAGTSVIFVTSKPGRVVAIGNAIMTTNFDSVTRARFALDTVPGANELGIGGSVPVDDGSGQLVANAGGAWMQNFESVPAGTHTLVVQGVSGSGGGIFNVGILILHK
jgi:hypothetical protein